MSCCSSRSTKQRNRCIGSIRCIKISERYRTAISDIRTILQLYRIWIISNRTTILRYRTSNIGRRNIRHIVRARDGDGYNLISSGMSTITIRCSNGIIENKTVIFSEIIKRVATGIKRPRERATCLNICQCTRYLHEVQQRIISIIEQSTIQSARYTARMNCNTLYYCAYGVRYINIAKCKRTRSCTIYRIRLGYGTGNVVTGNRWRIVRAGNGYAYSLCRTSRTIIHRHIKLFNFGFTLR